MTVLRLLMDVVSVPNDSSKNYIVTQFLDSLKAPERNLIKEINGLEEIEVFSCRNDHFQHSSFL